MAATESSTAADIFLQVIIAFLTPMFLSACGGDLSQARLAAFGAVSAYQAETQRDFLAIAQTIAFGLSALDSLARSMSDGLSIELVLRLRNSARSANRITGQTRSPPVRPRPASPHAPARQSHPSAPARQPRPVETPSPDQVNSHQAQEDERRTAWAESMLRVAEEVVVSLPTLKPDERQRANSQILGLRNTASSLLAARSHQYPTGTRPAAASPG